MPDVIEVIIDQTTVVEVLTDEPDVIEVVIEGPQGRQGQPGSSSGSYDFGTILAPADFTLDLGGF